MRTRLRRHLPFRLQFLAPKGHSDCGCHDWYKSEDCLYLCYHCDYGRMTKDLTQ